MKKLAKTGFEKVLGSLEEATKVCNLLSKLTVSLLNKKFALLHILEVIASLTNLVDDLQIEIEEMKK